MAYIYKADDFDVDRTSESRRGVSEPTLNRQHIKGNSQNGDYRHLHIRGTRIYGSSFVSCTCQFTLPCINIEIPVALYHVTTRSDKKADSYLHGGNREQFLKTFHLEVGLPAVQLGTNRLSDSK